MTKYSQITKTLLEWFQNNHRDLPWREVRTAYGTWVSEIMLQQTRVTTVIPYFNRFLSLFPDIPALAAARQADVYKAWEGLGYYSRARNLQRGAVFCVENFAGELPHDYKKLLSIPGIGPYTAGALSSLAFGLPCPAVDGNVIRVIARLFAMRIYPQDSTAKKEVTAIVREMLPKDQAGDFNEALMDLGAIICIPGNPLCGTCPLSKYCGAYITGCQAQIPLRRPAKESPVIPYTIIVLKKNQRLFIRQRPESGLLANLYEFPAYPGFMQLADLPVLLDRDFGISKTEITAITSLGRASHRFSHLKWQMDGYMVEISDNKKFSRALSFSEKQALGEYYPVCEAKKLAFPSALKVYTSIVFL